MRRRRAVKIDTINDLSGGPPSGSPMAAAATAAAEGMLAARAARGLADSISGSVSHLQCR